MDPRLVSLLATGKEIDDDGPCSAFQHALRSSSRLHHVVLVDRVAALPSFAEPFDGPVVLLNADRSEVMDLFGRFPIAAAVEKYALFTWWKYHREDARGFWLHGHRRVVERMEGVVVSPLYATENVCAFGSESMGLAELLAGYLSAMPIAEHGTAR
jgi:hypothetical protein